MDTPIEETKRIPKRKGRGIIKQEITKEEFLTNLGKVCQPISKESSESDSGKSET